MKEILVDSNVILDIVTEDPPNACIEYFLAFNGTA
jgi:hypothetical protein